MTTTATVVAAAAANSKLTHYLPGETLRTQKEVEAARICRKSARFSALCTGRLYPQEISLVRISGRG